LEKHGGRKAWLSRHDISRLLNVSILTGHDYNRALQIQLAVAILICLFTALRHSSLIGIHDRGRKAGEVSHISKLITPFVDPFSLSHLVT